MIKELSSAIEMARRIRTGLPSSVVQDTGPENEPGSSKPLHPFDVRNIHPKMHGKVKRLFDDGHYPEATFEATKYMEKCIKTKSGIRGKTGHALSMAAFNEEAPAIRLNNLVTESERDEQLGFKFIFAGVSSAIRNPRGHESNFPETTDECLDHLGVVSFLLRRLESAGHMLP
jgi:uncharacterized protein (TIGR02391 family)